jgi:ATF/CREB family transcription factor
MAIGSMGIALGGTGLTPLPVNFPPPSPASGSSGAYFNIPNTHGNASSSNAPGGNFTSPGNNDPNSSNTAPSATITPNTLSAISNAIHYGEGGGGGGPGTTNATGPSGGGHSYASNAATTAANGLFLLSQAHQELTKREEAQARQSQSHSHATNGIDLNGHVNGRTTRGAAKRKGYDPQDVSSQHPDSSSLRSSGTPNKRNRTGVSVRGGRGKFEDDLDDDEEEEEEEEEEPVHVSPGRRSGGSSVAKKPETEEEKRKNFLERNRQGIILFHVLCPLFLTFPVRFPIRSRSQMSTTQEGMALSATGD